MTGVRRYDGSDEAEALMAADPEPCRDLSGAAVSLIREALEASRAIAERRFQRGGWIESAAAREVLAKIDIALVFVSPVPMAGAEDTPETPSPSKGD